MLENSTPIEKRKILGSLSTMSVGENCAHTKYRHVNTRNGSQGAKKVVRLSLCPLGGGEPEPCICPSTLILQNEHKMDSHYLFAGVRWPWSLDYWTDLKFNHKNVFSTCIEVLEAIHDHVTWFYSAARLTYGASLAVPRI